MTLPFDYSLGQTKMGFSFGSEYKELLPQYLITKLNTKKVALFIIFLYP